MSKALPFLFVLFLFGNHDFTLVQASTGPARTSCDAAYNAPCSRVNSEWVATDTARRLSEELEKEQNDSSVFEHVTLQEYNMEKGFYPFVFDRVTSACVAHGSNPSLVGESLDSIFTTMGIGFSSATALHNRFVQAATDGGDWVQYIWRDNEDSPIVNKVAFVTNVTDRYYLGVGYNHEQLPPDLPCSDKFDSWCSINNVRSLVGKAQLRLNEAETLEQFEAALYDISFDTEAYVIPGGHYIFMYHYEGALMAHAHLHRFSGHALPYIFENLNRDPEEGSALHKVLKRAADGENDGWAQYKWKNKVDEPEYIKIAYNVKIEFMGEKYYLGCGYNFIMGDVVPASTTSDAVCSPFFNLPCAFGTTLQLSSHALSHAISSPLAVDDMFDAVALEPSLKSGDYFVFMFDYNSTCVAHGAVPSYKGMMAAQVFGDAGISASDGNSVNEHFRDAAELGGGYVYYDLADSNFRKISYIFKITLEGRDYYGGVGFDHQRAQVQLQLESGKQNNGDPILCSQEHGSNCSEINARAIMGQALADLVIASTETKVRTATEAMSSVEEVLAEVTAGNELYRVNDFFVSVFSLEQSLCSPDEEMSTGIIIQDNSGCCIAHGGNSTFVGKSWQDILDIQKITSIRGVDLHSRLIGQTDLGGHWTEYSWAESDGGARTRLAFSSRFKHNSQNYYIVVEYFKDPPPPTCDACPNGMECTREDQAFCEVEVSKTEFIESNGFIAMLVVVLGVPLMGFVFCWIGKRNEKRQAAAQLREIDAKMQTMSKQIELEKKTASKTQKLVSSLFPQSVQDRILQEIEEEGSSEAEEAGPTTTTEKLTSYLKDHGTSKGGGMAKSSRPIAEYYLESTIFFGDISGFTSWSSTRNPSQVFSLLETLYQQFDRIASSLDVFKVETIGDCYVAVAGLPNPRSDHAVVMAQFGNECLYHFSVLVKQLEKQLGPDTGDLGLRIGLHSGPVTAGVLRGERGRFQLFGDTVNTASRMESNGATNKIHLSQETADLLAEAGCPHWATPRKDKIVAKGKGLMNTHWLVTTVPDLAVGDRKHPERTPEASPVATGFEKVEHKSHRLVDWNVDVLCKVLVHVVRRRKACAIKPDSPECLRQLEEKVESNFTTLKEVKEIVSLPRFNPNAVKQNLDAPKELDKKAQEQLRSYVAAIMQMYRDNPFHSFEHASHVTMSVVKLLDRIVAPQLQDTSSNSLHDHTYGITSDPLVQFACILSALIHDVDHTGVPNSQLIKEKNSLASFYENKSVAELNSLDLSWSLLMQEEFAELRKQIYSTEAEFHHFRQLMVNIVLATDIVDKELKSLRNTRWERAFSQTTTKDENVLDTINRKATIVIEHLIQASDVSHTMQHWMVYQKWNERFFKECYEAYKAGRSEKDPSVGWYKGEIGFFDFYIIPLAKKLKDCGVFGVSSDEYLRYALNNRKEWEARGEEVVASMLEKYR